MQLDPGGYTRKNFRHVATNDTPTVVETIPVALTSTVGTWVTVLARRTDSGNDAFHFVNVSAMSREAGDAVDLYAGAGNTVIIAGVGSLATYPAVGNDGTGDLNECRVVLTGAPGETWDFTVTVEVFEVKSPS